MTVVQRIHFYTIVHNKLSRGAGRGAGRWAGTGSGGGLSGGPVLGAGGSHESDLKHDIILL